MLCFVVTLALLVLVPCVWILVLSACPELRPKLSRYSASVGGASTGAAAGLCFWRFDVVGFVALLLLAIVASVLGRLIRGPLRVYFRIAGPTWLAGAAVYGLWLLWRLRFE